MTPLLLAFQDFHLEISNLTFKGLCNYWTLVLGESRNKLVHKIDEVFKNKHYIQLKARTIWKFIMQDMIIFLSKKKTSYD